MKIGEFRYTKDFLEKNPKAAGKIFSKLEFVPTSVNYDHVRKQFVCVGYSPLFREIELGRGAPKYELQITQLQTELPDEPDYLIYVEEIEK